MDPNNPKQKIIAKIRTLEPEHASKIICYFMSQYVKDCELYRMALGPDIILQDFCRKAKSDLGLSSTLNPYARPFNVNDQSLSPSSPRNLNHPLSPSLIQDNPNGSSQEQQLSHHFANLHKGSISANDAQLESEEPGYWFLPSDLVDGFGSPSDQQRMIAGGSPMSNRQGSRQFGVEGGFGSPSEQQRMIAGQSMTDFGSPMSNRLGSRQFGVEGGFGSPSEQQRMIAGQSMADFGSPMSNRRGSGKFGVKGGNCHRPVRHSVFKTIYLTFPHESFFTGEDVSTYFSKFGAVEEIQIPNEERRMYGFVTFADAETVRTILRQPKSHLIGGYPVIVKPYKEREELLQKKQ